MSLSQSLAFTEFGLMRALATAEAAENAEERWRKSLEAAEEDLRTEREDRRKDAEERRVLELALKEALARLGEEDNEQTEQTTMQGNPTVLDARDRISRGSGDVDQRKTTSNPPDTSQAALHEVSNTATVSARESSSPATTFCPTCSYPQSDPDPSSPNALTIGTPSNILLGINGIRRLFSDFSQSISAKEKAIVALERERARLQVEMEVLKKSEELERRRRVENEEELARIKENDEGAAKVVERYMWVSGASHP
jgi:peptidoglycan hydrolase CwlO-like protein